MAECKYCFSRNGEPHLGKCPAVDPSNVHKVDGLIPGTMIGDGRYRVGMALNHGGFGIAYVCKDTQFDRRIVIKEFFPNGYSHRDTNRTNTVAYHNISGDALLTMQAQFYREYDIMTKAACPGIPAVYDFFTENNSAYIAMDYIPGRTFKSYLQDRKKPMEWWKLRSKFFLPLMDTIANIHRKGILHRDISLVNLMITPDERIILLDFGAGRDFHEPDTVERMRFANKMYAPIEQTNPDPRYPHRPRTDIFAMGTVFYTAITMHYPPNALERPQKAVDSALKYVPDLPEPIDDALMKSLYYLPQYRFQTVSEFRDALMSVPDPKKKWFGDKIKFWDAVQQ